MECWLFREAFVPSPRSLFLEAQGLCEVTSGSREEATTGALLLSLDLGVLGFALGGWRGPKVERLLGLAGGLGVGLGNW